MLMRQRSCETQSVFTTRAKKEAVLTVKNKISLQLDPNSTENFFGVIAAVYSLGQALSSPVFGFWSNKIKQTRYPTMVGISLAVSALGIIAGEKYSEKTCRFIGIHDTLTLFG